jgi:hypothetical protein
MYYIYITYTVNYNMLIKVIDVMEYKMRQCEFQEYTPLLELEVTTDTLKETNIYDLLKNKFDFEFNLYTINEASDTLEIFRKKNHAELNILSLLQKKEFDELVLYLILGRFVSENVDEVTTLYATSQNEDGKICKLKLNGLEGLPMFKQAESSVHEEAGAGAGSGGRTSRKHRKGKRGGRVKRRTRKPRRRGTKHYK